MRPAYLDKIVFDLEKNFYGSLLNTDLAKNLVRDYPNQPIESLAKTMAQGLKDGPMGDLARRLSEGSKGCHFYDELCQEAFENSMLRLLKGTKESVSLRHKK